MASRQGRIQYIYVDIYIFMWPFQRGWPLVRVASQKGFHCPEDNNQTVYLTWADFVICVAASSPASKDMTVLKEHLKSLNTELILLQRHLEPPKSSPQRAPREAKEATCKSEEAATQINKAGESECIAKQSNFLLTN